jgi:predicted naringenin-chalcone synthase
VECRRSGGTGDHTLVITFSNELVSGNAAVTEGTGTIAGSPTFSGNTMTVNLTGVPNAEQVRVTLGQVTDSFAQTYPDTVVTMKALFGDAGGNSAVSGTDVAQVKSEVGNPATATNFRADVTTEGAITSSDVAAVKSMAGAVLP